MEVGYSFEKRQRFHIEKIKAVSNVRRLIKINKNAEIFHKGS